MQCVAELVNVGVPPLLAIKFSTGNLHVEDGRVYIRLGDAAALEQQWRERNGPVTGGAAEFGGSATGWFGADAYFSGGNTASPTARISTSGVSDPAAAAAAYQTERWGARTYTITGLAANASHTVRLHFAEIYWNGANQRKFHVNIKGTRVLTDFDIFATAGAKNKALV